MPIVIPKELPAYDVLTKENVFVMPKLRAEHQDIRPIEIAIVNLMPTKIDTETQLMRLLGNTSLQVNVTLISMESYVGHYTSLDHMNKFYKTFSEIKDKHFDGFIVTGAPIEKLDFEEVAYWDELKVILDWTKTNVTSTIFICWASQAALHYFYGIDKHLLDNKMFGIYPSQVCDDKEWILKGMDDTIYIPMSRHTAIDEAAVLKNKDLKVLAYGKDCGISIIKSIDNKQFFFIGHSEYDRTTLKTEYLRDLEKGLPISKPVNYFIDDDLNRIDMKWKSTANLLFYNWLNYVYQVTPYDFTEN